MLKPGQFITTFKTKKGHEITVRVVDKNDAQKLMDFINPIFSEDTFLLRGPKDLVKNLKEEQKFLKEQLRKIKKDEGFHLVAVHNDTIVGSIDLRRMLFRQKHMGEIGITISASFREEGIGQKLLQLIEKQAKTLGLKAVFLFCLANNSRALYVYEKMGYKKVGMLPKAYEYKGELVDSITMWKEI